MNESTLPSSDPGTQKRRSTRIVQAVPITVSGVDALGQPFKERTTTVMVNCHGCKYQSKHYVPKNSMVTLEIPRMEPGVPPRIVPGHVVWVQRPRTVRELFQIGLEFEAAGNVWGIAFPPEDWVPSAEDEAVANAAASEIEVIVETKPAAAAPSAGASIDVKPEKPAVAPGPIPPPPAMRTAPPPAPGTPSTIPATAPAAGATVPPVPPKPAAPPVPAAPAASVPPAGMTADAKIHVMPSPAAGGQDAQIVIARQMAKIVAEAKDTLDKTLRRGAQTAINEEMTIVRQQLDAQMHETVEHAIKSSIERVSEAEVKKVVLQAANKTAAIVEEARLASQANVEQIDTKVREAVQQAVSQATSQAAAQTAAIAEEARKAAQEAASQAAEQAAQRATAIVEETRRANEASAQTIEEQVRRSAHEAATQAAKEVVQQTVAQDLRQSVEELVGRAIAERESNVPSLQVLTSPEAAQQHLDEWKKNLEEAAHGVHSQMVAQTEAEAEAASRRWHQELEAMLAGTSQKLGERLSEVSQAALADGEKQIAERGSSLRGLIDEVVSGAEAAVLSLGTDLAQQLTQQRAQTEETKAELEEAAKAAVEQTRRQMDEMVAAQHDAIAQRADQVIAERIQHIDPILQNSAQKTLEHFSSELDQRVAPKVEEIRRAASELTTAQQQAEGFQDNLRREIQQAAEQAQQIQESIRGRIEAASGTAVKNAVAELALAGQEAVRLQNSVRDEIRQASEQVSHLGNSTVERLQAASSEAAQRVTSEVENARQLAAQLQKNLRDQAQQASEHAAELQMLARERVQQASEEAVQEALGRMKQETAKFPAEIEQTCRATVKKLEEELDQKSSEMQHASHEALLKTSEWYQKKAQTTMHSTMERLVEQSANAMHAKAGEVSSMVASELDHYRRSYVEHSRAEIEEASNEVMERERLKLNETAEIANATFSDRVQRVTHESLQRFQDSSREALEKSRSDMEFNRECSLAEFQKVLDEKMTHGVEQASTYLQSQLIPLLESWEAKREAEKKEWMAQVKQSSEESLEAYKARLENATNAWLLASAATLGQNSQAVLDNLAKTAEKRMRDTCSQVLSGMGDLLRNRMMGISTDLSEEDETGKK